MALVAKMAASQVTASGGGRWAPCNEDDDGAQPVDDVGAIKSMYGVPPWLNTTGFVRYESVGQNGEHIKLTAVSAKDEDDPNREWAMASPSGDLQLFIQNPAAFGYVQAGQEYRVTIERIRGPRSVPDKPLAPAFRVNGGAGVTINAGSSTNTVG